MCGRDLEELNQHYIHRKGVSNVVLAQCCLSLWKPRKQDGDMLLQSTFCYLKLKLFLTIWLEALF